MQEGYLSVICNYDAMRCQGSYMPSSTEIASINTETLQKNPFTRDTILLNSNSNGSKDDAHKRKHTPLEPSDLTRFTKYSENPIEAIDEVERLKPVNLRETVEVCTHSSSIVLNFFLSNRSVISLYF